MASELGHLFYVALGNYENAKLDAAFEMLNHPDCIPALGDGGAHYGAICDASYSTFMLTHWVLGVQEQRIDLAVLCPVDRDSPSLVGPE